MLQFNKNNDALGAINRGVPCESGLCTLCDSSCKGKCETWLSCLEGRKMLYPRRFGHSTSGASHVTAEGIGYHGLRIQGYAYGSTGMAEGLTDDPDDCIFTNVNIETEFGNEIKTKSRLPIMTGALGSTFIAAKYWPSFAVGAALAGFPIVVGENVVGVDRKSELKNGRITKAPELERRIEYFNRYYDGYGAIIIQMNVEDARNGVAGYLIEKYGNDVIIELKWGQGAKDIGGEIQVTSLEYAQFLKDRGYIVDPDPYSPVVIKGYENRAVTAFARHSRLGATNLHKVDKVREEFMTNVAYLRKLGFKRITLKTGAYGMENLAMAIRFASDAHLDLLTIDGAGGGTGMSPWNMMQHWGIPSLPLHAKAYEYCSLLEQQGKNVPDLSFAGGFAREDHLFKALSLGAPYTKMVCLGRAPMIAGFLGSNIEATFYSERRPELNGHWEKLPPTVTEYGIYPEEIFSEWETVKNKVGADEMKKIPFGAIAMMGYADKLAAGLQQFMAGARKFNIHELTREDLIASNRETAEVTNIPFMTEALDEQARSVLFA
ncbi:MAG: glutamate synthase-related protein [Tangfeifania sp.]